MIFRIAIIFAICFCVELTRSATMTPQLQKESPVYDTIVVGLGASGLSAFSKLARHGKHVLGLEAADRIGGRVYTVNFGEELVELGAEWIHGKNNSRTYELAFANNVNLKIQSDRDKIYSSDGSEINEEQIQDVISNCLRTPGPNVEPQPIGQFYTEQCKQYLSQHKPEILQDEDLFRELLALMDFYISTDEASDNWNQVTTQSKFSELDEFYSVSWHKYGYKTLFEIILNKYNNGPGLPQNGEIELNKEVTQILWTQDPTAALTVKCKDGSEYKAKNVIITTSLGVLKANHQLLFSPCLPEKKVNAINNISMGLLDKVLLSFDNIWWPQNISTFLFIWKEDDKAKVSEEDQWTKVYAVSQSMGSDNVLEVWFIGESARHVETLPEHVVKNKIVELLRKFMGNDVEEPNGIIITRWWQNPFTLGSYSFDNLQTPQKPDVREDLAAPILDSAQIPRVLFAGEATNYDGHFATVHGAIETGIREANRLLGVHDNTIY